MAILGICLLIVSFGTESVVASQEIRETVTFDHSDTHQSNSKSESADRCIHGANPVAYALIVNQQQKTDTCICYNLIVQNLATINTLLVTGTGTIDGNLILNGTLIAATNDVNGGQIFINSNVALHGSNSGIQYSTTSSNRAQLRENQYGANVGIPGISTFKSRGATIGSLAPVNPLDVIFRITAVGVTSNLSIPLSGLISINVPAGGVPAGQGYIATEYELQLVSLDGPANGRRVVFKISSEGVPQLIETTSAGPHTTVPSGVVTLGAAGTATVANSKIPANARILLTVQPGPAPVGTIYASAITANTSFTITSTAGAADTGLNVYYQIYIPLP